MKTLLKGGLLVALAALAVLFFVLDPNKNIIFPRCPFYSLTGFYCPGCGSQRAIHSLLHLNLAGVVQSNLLFIPAVLTIGYHFLHKILNRKLGWNLPNIFYLKNTPWVILAIILLFWVLRNISEFPFSELAPG
ncbi:Protein of unknown function [Mariniphaga anaerophila]|uniref:DUF2752 domain-containing protein n=1 Tax=Mariniphaga anaerophila TaxID=1484053 RepID=A0A1M5CA04_9BACT|nr:DUF2752 domain-containing protein [Mariniphaga anaerophila]SHF51583.1 Protein of unknown function [Mariniphaga anaerophila]